MKTLKDIGEKEIIRTIIKPLFNPSNLKNSIGDDCAVIPITKDKCICVSTDRVPADLISYKIGLINHYQLGYYLAVLNISDIASSGATPKGLMLTLAFEQNFLLSDFRDILEGIKDCCKKYGCDILGGDLSDSKEINLSATSIGIIETEKVLYRSNAKEEDLIFCSDYIGLTPTAFKYFLKLRPNGFRLREEEESILADQFRKPKARVSLGKILSESKLCSSCMDNTDGFSQTFSELSEINNLGFLFYYKKLPIHDISFKVAKKLDIDIIDLVFSAGADFQLLGTVKDNDNVSLKNIIFKKELTIIGKTEPGLGLKLITNNGHTRDITPDGWNYYIDS